MVMLPQPTITDLVYNGKCWVMNDLTNKPVMLQRENPSGGARVKQANPISIPASDYGWYQFWMYHLYTNDNTPLRFDFYNQNNQLIYSWREQIQSANGSVSPSELISSDAGNQLVTGSDNNLFVPPGSGNVLILMTSVLPPAGGAAEFDYVIVTSPNYSPDLAFMNQYTIYQRDSGGWTFIEPGSFTVPISTLIYFEHTGYGPAWFKAVYPNGAHFFTAAENPANLWWQRISYANNVRIYGDAGYPVVVFAEPTNYAYRYTDTPGTTQPVVFASHAMSQVIVTNVVSSTQPFTIAGTTGAVQPGRSILVSGSIDLSSTYSLL